MPFIANLRPRYQHLPDHLAARVLNKLFPRDSSAPTIGDIMAKDLSTGIACLNHINAGPLVTAPAYLIRLLLVAIGQQVQGNQRLMKQIKALELTELVTEMSYQGRIDAQWERKLAIIRDTLREKRNQLEQDPATAGRSQVVAIQRQLELIVGFEDIV